MSSTKLETKQKAAVEGVRQRPAVAPRVDVFENAQEYLLVADLPGVTQEALNISLDDDELTLDARRDAAPPGAVIAGEYRSVDYFRKFAVPRGIDPDRIEAALSDGLLRLKLPKAESLRPRQIPIRSA
jgi:HSP20 family molecular chaperone IbpA